MDKIEEYIMQFPDNVRDILQKIRQLIKDSAPDAEETMAYGMPAYRTGKKPLVYFAAFKNHVGFYATPDGHSEFQNELAKYKHGKGSVQFPLSSPMPYDLMERIVQFKAKENRKADDKKPES